MPQAQCWTHPQLLPSTQATVVVMTVVVEAGTLLLLRWLPAWLWG